MAISVSDLPPKYQAQALRKYMAQQKRRGQPLPISADGPQKASKYHNSPTERVTGGGTVLRFDSQKEAWRYDQLIELERAGQIRELRLQVDFTLQEAYTDTQGRRVRAIRYRADFTYRKPMAKRWAIYADNPVEWTDKLGLPWELVVEDVKSRATRTKAYEMKRKMMKDRFGIDIREV